LGLINATDYIRWYKINRADGSTLPHIIPHDIKEAQPPPKLKQRISILINYSAKSKHILIMLPA
jgi:hypothetical protein